MNSGLEGGVCQTCYGQGMVPTDAGSLTCPDCGGTGKLPHEDTNIEWRVRAIERTFGEAETEVGDALRWLVFELRRARGALTEILALGEELPESPELTRIKFVANRALKLYDERGERLGPSVK